MAHLYDSDESTSEDDDSTVDVSTPRPRFWHFSQLVEGNVCIGGGNIPQFAKGGERARLAKTIEQFNVEERKWRQRETKGDHHPGLTGVACASFGKYLFAYGGNNGEDLNGVLSKLDLDKFKWSRLSPETADGPMKKDACGMVHFGEGKLAVVCGYADPRDPLKHHGGSSDQKSTFIERSGPSAEGGGWTNEMHVFNINHKTKDDHQGMWTIFSFTGSRPPPCADFSLTSVDLYRAVLYGGRRGTDEDSNDFYIINFSEKAIMKIQPQNKEDRWPKMRLGHHAACCLDFNTQNPQLLVSGGWIKHELPPKDIWILDLAIRKWKQVELLIADESIQKQLARWGHTFTAITHSEGLVEVIMFGGSPGFYEVTWDVYKRKDFGRLSFPVSFIFGLLDKEWAILDVLDCSQRWTSKTMTPFDLKSTNSIMLDVLYSMERDKIPVLTELTRNKKIRSTICSEAATEANLKWPTFTKPSFHEPTWENLILILKLVKENDDLVKMIKRYLKAPMSRKRLLTDRNFEGRDAKRPRRKLQQPRKSYSTLDAGAASHISNTSSDSVEEDDCIEPRRQEPVQQPQALSPHQPQLGSTSESATAQQQIQTKLDELPTLDKLTLLKYTYKGKRQKVQIVSEASHKWKTIASLICDDPNRTAALEQKYSDPEECLRQTLIDNFINKKPKNYTQDWNGLIELLDDVDLETLAKRVKDAVLV